jgi:hypothetical protein
MTVAWLADEVHERESPVLTREVATAPPRGARLAAARPTAPLAAVTVRRPQDARAALVSLHRQ